MGGRNIPSRGDMELEELIDDNGTCVMCGHEQATHCAEVHERGVVARIHCESCSPIVAPGWEARHIRHDDGTVDITERHLVEYLIPKSCWMNANPRKAVRMLESEGEYSSEWQRWRLFDHRRKLRRRRDEDVIKPKGEQYLFAAMQKNVCAGCQHQMPAAHLLTIDHISPKSKDGGNQASNIQLLCHTCNSIKGNRSMEYLKSRLQIKGIMNPRFSEGN